MAGRLSCMLKQKPGASLAEKLRPIALLEASYNKDIKELSGNKMVEVVRSIDFMPKEICNERG